MLYYGHSNIPGLGNGSFLHYDESNDLAYCHICMTGFKQKKKMKAAKADPAFVSAISQL